MLLQDFLSSQWATLNRLQQEMSRISGSEKLLSAVISDVLDLLDDGRGILYPDRHILLRSIPVMLNLLCPTEAGAAATIKSVGRKQIDRALRAVCVTGPQSIPLIGDVFVQPVAVLRTSVFFQAMQKQGERSFHSFFQTKCILNRTQNYSNWVLQVKFSCASHQSCRRSKRMKLWHPLDAI